MKMKQIALIFSLITLFFCEVIFAEVRLPAVISDNMVLQQEIAAPLWGWAEPGEKITVKADWQSSSISTLFDKSGKWQLKINTPKAGGPYKVKIHGDNVIVLANVLIGEVWFCSGQSNMHLPMKYVDKWHKGVINYQQEIANADCPDIRIFSVEMDAAEKPKKDVTGSWLACKPQTVADFSAVAYFFGRNLNKELNVPIGLIHSSYGGTPVESWTSIEMLESDFKDLLKRQRTQLPKYEAHYKQKLKKWKENKSKCLNQENLQLPKPSQPVWLRDSWQPGWLYNAMVSPLMPYRIKGVIWYQGESNTERAYQYRTLFPAMIKDWRRNWSQGDFPFIFVQLANFKKPNDKPVEDSWAELREAQLMTLDIVENVGMAVSIDIGEANDIHPSNKQDVGSRLALWALANTYGKDDVAYSGPIYKAMKIEKNKIRLFFDHAKGGLFAKGGPLKRFAIAGRDKKFVWSDAEIDGQTVLVHSNQISSPVAVRYAWSINPEGCNLYNKAGLPASPFRTDDWPGETIGKE